MLVNKKRFKNLPVKFKCVTHIRADTVLQASQLNMRLPLTTILCVLSCLLVAVAGKSHSPLSSLQLQSSRFAQESQERPDLRCERSQFLFLVLQTEGPRWGRVRLEHHLGCLRLHL